MLETNNSETIAALKRVDYWSSGISGFHNSSLLSILAVRHVLTPKRSQVPREAFALVHSSDAEVWENKKALPHSFVVTTPVIVETDDQALDRLCAPDFNFQKTVVITADPGYAGEYISKDEEAGVLLPAAIKRYDAEVVEIQANSPGDGWLILSDLFFPGSKAMVDGKEAAIFRGNYLFRAVKISRGLHNVSFVYRPVSFRLGMFLSIFGIVTVLLLVFHRSFMGVITRVDRGARSTGCH